MRKAKKLFWILGIIVLLIGTGGFLWQLLSSEERIYFDESMEYQDNPDRGIYVQVETDEPDHLDKYGKLEGKEKLRLVLLAYDLVGYENEEFIDEQKLEELKTALEAARQNHFSVIFRTAYHFDRDYTEPENISYVCNHIDQISLVLQEYTDILLCVQAGMIGPYGEWHTSRYIEPEYTAEAQKVVMEWMNQLPDEICIALRRPSFVREAIRRGADADRLTVHNDALLSNASDMGTYNEKEMSREEELSFIGAVKPVYTGGEMTAVSDYTQIDKAVWEFSKMEIGYLNRYYNQDVWNEWANQTYEGQPAEEYIIQHLGYRLVMEDAVWKRNPIQNEIQIHIENKGFGNLDDRYRFYLYVDDGENKLYYELQDEDERDKSYDFSLQWGSSRENKLRMGIKIARKEIHACVRTDCIKLMNEGILFEDGINYIK